MNAFLEESGLEMTPGKCTFCSFSKIRPASREITINNTLSQIRDCGKVFGTAL
jgi:hypothetical protein